MEKLKVVNKKTVVPQSVEQTSRRRYGFDLFLNSVMQKKEGGIVNRARVGAENNVQLL
jgi:hypothetical protein